MAMRRGVVVLVVLVALASACSSSPEVTSTDRPAATVTTTDPVVTSSIPVEPLRAETYVPVLARTANLGGTLETPRGASWGSDFEPSDLDLVADRGFTAVRLPIRFSEWSDTEPPYAIDAELIEHVDAYIDRAEALGIGIIIDLHHFNEMMVDPNGNRDRLVGLWRQIVRSFGDRDPRLVSFELLNEPHGELTPELWNDVLADVVEAIRGEGIQHTLIFGPGSWNNLRVLDQLVVPDDENLIVTFHYYEPFRFTHQGADWVAGDMVDVRASWDPDVDGAGAIIDADFAAAADWASAADVPLFLGEFGVHTVAEPEDRVAWIDFMRRTAEKYDIAWAIWDLTGEKFGMFDETANTWDAELVSALGLRPL